MVSERNAAPRARVAFALLLVLLGGCAGSFRPFTTRPVLWDDPDREDFAPSPEVYVAPHAWNEVDQMVFRRFARLWLFDPGREAVNVNALDEVPDSSWFTGRVGRYRGLPEAELLREIAAGPCRDVPAPTPPLTITRLERDGAMYGLRVRDARSTSWYLRLDTESQPERATAAEVIGARLYHAAGYAVPCTRAYFFVRDDLRFAEDASTNADGADTPLAQTQLERALAAAHQRADGTLRAAAIATGPGTTLGPWRYEGVREDDYNDVVPHEDRRELRASYLLASWLNHYDASERNTRDRWVRPDPTREPGHIEHLHAGFSDALGAMPPELELARRVGGGHSGFFDLDHVVADFLTLGSLSRRYHANRLGVTGRILGYWNVRDFAPGAWRPGYPNPAFERATPRDFAWMARILAHLDPSDLRSVVAHAEIEDPQVRAEVERILLGRHRRLLEHWLPVVSPLTRPLLRRVRGRPELCLEDLMVRAELVDPRERAYWARADTFAGGTLSPLTLGPLVRRAPAHVCVALPEELPEYLILQIAAREHDDDDDPRDRPLWVHLRGGEVVGIERPYDGARPRP